ncbi:hypothetical protein ACFE33_05940 [Falsihalocynthiibacter sp. SS001]|uniref:hypothetical protein n=1 Tax=Falsihalocynthiibacter sp. SS001 TaxID=3349698 RepID=UPI0036D2451D
MRTTLHTLEARGIRAIFDIDGGQLAALEVERNGRKINPWARVPWADAPDDPSRFTAETPNHLRRMSGDFFCAPFVRDDLNGGPVHGWTANGTWSFDQEIEIEGGRQATFNLAQTIAGAQVQKIWTLLDDHPFLYQCHRFTGGKMPVPVAHHAMVNLREGGRLAFSAKKWMETPDTPPENASDGGKSILTYPTKTSDLTSVSTVNGPVDITQYPFAEGHDDFAMLVDDPQGPYGWATAVRPSHNDIAMLIKPVSVLPQTMLWMSNGGRPYAPWNGEHVGVLGIEEAASYGPHGWKASIEPNALSEQGISTCVDLTKSDVVEIRTAMGAIASNAAGPVRMEIKGDRVVLESGEELPFAAHLVV